MIWRILQKIKVWWLGEEPKPLTCPYCGNDQFHEGPSGGAAQLVMCSNEACHHEFRHVWNSLEDLHKVEQLT